MTAIVDKKSVGNSSKLEGDCSLSMPGANGRRGLELPPEAAANSRRQTLAHSKTLREFRCPFSAASEGNDSMRNRLPVAPVIL